MTSQPWLKFYPTNWRADPALRMCSIGARGLWMEMICVMHEASPRGFLIINGCSVSERQLASLAGATVEEVSGLLAELEHAGVFSRDDNRAIYSRRMVRDTERSEEGKRFGSLGGNPILKGDDGKRDNPPVNPSLVSSSSISEHIPPSQEEASPRAKNAAIGREFAEVFYPAYPHKVQRAAAQKAWPRARSKATLEQIMAGLQRYIRDKPPDQHWRNPATFLNGESWNDQPASPPSSANAKPGTHTTILRSIARAVEKRTGLGVGEAGPDDGLPFDGQGPPEAGIVAGELAAPALPERH